MATRQQRSLQHFTREIARLGAMSKFSASEIRRAAWDLQTVKQRLERRQYRITSFNQNKFHIPDRAADFFTELKFHAEIGRSWAAVLERSRFERYGRIVDLCPGYGPKIQLGLFYAGFRGEVTVIDKSKPALKRLVDFMSLFNTGIRCRAVQADLRKLRGRAYDLVLANHLLDDLLIDYLCRLLKIPARKIYESEETLSELWRYAISRRQQVLSGALPEIAQIFMNLTAKNGKVIFSQYQSYVERVLALPKVTAYNRSLAGALIEELSSRGFCNQTAELRRSLGRLPGQLTARDFYALQRE